MSQRYDEKIAAFLRRPPHAALMEDWRQAGWEVAEAALGCMLTADRRGELEEVESTARGLDLPPWIDTLDAAAFRRNPLVRHPLSGAARPLSIRSDVAPQELHRSVVQEVGRLREEAGGDPRACSLLLWRLLPERLSAACPEVPWQHLPADGRVPSHSWWEHASVASAVAGAWPNPAVFLFTIASAQEFVSTARRTQDAWMGSYLLSYLAWCAARVVCERCGPDALLSPSLRGQPLADLWLRRDCGLSQVPIPRASNLFVGNVPNLFTALVPAGEVDAIAAAAEAAVREGWERVAEAVRCGVERVVEDDSLSSWGPLWERQVRDLPGRLGLFWAACPWAGADPGEVLNAAFREPSSGNADLWRTVLAAMPEGSGRRGLAYPWLAGFAGRALTARKNVRTFRQTQPGGEPGEKCTLCGQLEALHPRPEQRWSPAELNKFWQKLAEVDRPLRGELKLLGRLRRGERLCAVCLTKRLALESYFESRFEPEVRLDHHVFPSTSTVAAAQFLLDVAEKGATPWECLLSHAECVHDTLDAAGALVPANLPDGVKAVLQPRKAADRRVGKLLRLDGDWLFPESFDADAVGRELPSAVSFEALRKCRDSATQLKKACAEAGVAPLPRYYAVVALDGDEMGEWVKGTKGAPWAALFHPDLPNQRAATQDLTRPMGPAMHLALSDCLQTLALHLVRPIVARYGGSLIYAGGDDVLAFLPVPRLFEALSELREAFVGGEDGWNEAPDGSAGRVLGGRGGMTVSAGVAIVHRSRELSQAIQEAQQLLKKKAKDELGRNAFALGLLRRSGETTESGWSFETEGEGSLLNAMQKMLTLFTQGTVSTRLAYRVADCRWAVGNPEAFESEVLRLVGQHTRSKADREAVADAVKRLWGALRRGLAPSPRKDRRPIPSPESTQAFGQLLLLTSFLTGREG